MRYLNLLILPLAFSMPVALASAENVSAEIASLRRLVEEMQHEYATRIDELEKRLARSEQLARSAQQDAVDAFELAEESAIAQSSGLANANTYNPAIGATLLGRYANVDSGWDEIPGFQPSGEIGTGDSGFSLGEAEVNLNSSIDSSFFGNLTLGFHDEGGEVEVELEEAWLQTTDLPAGLSIRAGRQFSSVGYLNNFHFHSDDFADRPLPYQAFLGGRYFVDGVQARWVAPTPLFFELGTELNWGDGFPATANADTSPGAWSAFAKLGGDIGMNTAWQLGLSYIDVDANDRGTDHGHEPVDDIAHFTGDSDLAILDFVWKWTPASNASVLNLKLQGEYFKRSEDGEYGDSPYDDNQSGWYLQGVMQFAPRWRAGVRYDLVDAGSNSALDGTHLEDPGRSSKRSSVMLDWSASEFSRLRLQYSHDEVLPKSEHQWLVQYIMSLGAHGAHQF